jgi:hypothetical protein
MAYPLDRSSFRCEIGISENSGIMTAVFREVVLVKMDDTFSTNTSAGPAKYVDKRLPSKGTCTLLTSKEPSELRCARCIFIF